MARRVYDENRQHSSTDASKKEIISVSDSVDENTNRVLLRARALIKRAVTFSPLERTTKKDSPPATINYLSDSIITFFFWRTLEAVYLIQPSAFSPST